jgi:lysozyme
MRFERRRLGGLGLTGLGLAGAAVLAAWLWSWWFPRFEPARAETPLRGVDVSHHQGRIDWRRVAADDIAFAYLKASEGGDHRDRRFQENWRGARAAGLKVGAYHYFTFCRRGAEQAANFLAAAPHAPDALPPAVDLEFGGNCGRELSHAQLRRELDAFLAPVEARAGRPAVLYVTPEFSARYGAALPERPMWRRSIVMRPPGPWAIWQYHNRGRVDGVQGPVDLNVATERLER